MRTTKQRWTSSTSRKSAEAALQTGLVDLTAFGRPYIGNPDLAERLKHGWLLTEADRSTYYTGFTDFCCPFTQRCIHGSLRPGACTIERRLSYIRAPDMRSLGLGRRAAAYRHVDTHEAIV